MAEKFKVEIDGKEVEVVRADEFDKDVNALYKEMREAKEARDTVRKELADAKAQVEDLSKSKSDLEKQVETASKDNNNEDITKLTADRDNLQNQLKKTVEEKESLQGKIKTLTVDNTLKNALSKFVVSDALEDAFTAASRRVTCNDKMEISVVDEHGNEVRNEKGDPISVEAYAEKFAKERPYFARSDLKPGSGALPGSDNGIDLQKRWSQMDAKEKSEFENKFGKDKMVEKIRNDRKKDLADKT